MAGEDRELARADQARMRAADRDADALVRARPESGAEPTRREDVLARLGWELESIRQTAGEERRAHAEAARRVLEQALEREPEDEGLALMLAELLLTDLADAKAAREIVQRFGARPGAKARWALLRRQVAALSGAAVLADVLIVDRLADRRKARAVATRIVARLSEGAPYEEAEHVVLGAAPGP